MEFREISDIRELYELERKSYHEEEAASWEGVQYRFKHCPQLFLGLFGSDQAQNPTNKLDVSEFSKGKLLGFIMSTASKEQVITEGSMSHHDHEGKTVCIHSVCVDSAYRRKGFASKLLNKYIELVRKLGYKRISLISHDYLVPLYQCVGFVVSRVSPIHHGPEPWIELNLEL